MGERGGGGEFFLKNSILKFLKNFAMFAIWRMLIIDWTTLTLDGTPFTLSMAHHLSKGPLYRYKKTQFCGSDFLALFHGIARVLNVNFYKHQVRAFH